MFPKPTQAMLIFFSLAPNTLLGINVGKAKADAPFSIVRRVVWLVGISLVICFPFFFFGLNWLHATGHFWLIGPA
jgi:hypothetical protein